MFCCNDDGFCACATNLIHFATDSGVTAVLFHINKVKTCDSAP